MLSRPSAEFQRFARATIDAGADLYLGHSAHVLQGIEVYRGKPIFYDAGDFVDDYAVDPELRNDRSALILCDLGVTGVKAVCLLPTLIDDCQVNLATGDDFAAVATRLQRLSAESGTRLEVNGTAIEVQFSPASSA
jgi:poly-gamma-glutamate synthesis protein (capsule biosynthesis protein)